MANKKYHIKEIKFVLLIRLKNVCHGKSSGLVLNRKLVIALPMET